MSNSLSFGTRLKQLRLDNHLGLRELGRLVEISAMHLSNLEKGRSMPSPELVNKLATILNGNRDELLYLSEHVDPEIVDVIHNNPYQVPSFLRSAKNLTPEQWEKLQKQVERMAKQKKDEKSS